MTLKKERVRPVTIGSDKYPKNVQTLQLQLMSNEKLLCPAGEINLVMSFCAKNKYFYDRCPKLVGKNIQSINNTIANVKKHSSLLIV